MRQTDTGMAIRTPAPCGALRRGIAAAALLALAACGPEPAPPAAGVPEDGWYEFQGSWNATGTRRVISLGGDRRASLVELTGPLLLAGPGRPGTGFTAKVIGLNDTAVGLVGRAVWTDEKGDEVYSWLDGQGTTRNNRITGKLIGGTGRYAGATGRYELSWQSVIETDDGTVQGRSVDLKGRVRLPAPPERRP
jgi:hypothetical protein